MNWGSVALWGFVGALVLTTTMAGSQWLGLTRMNIPFLLGTIFTADRDRARLVGDLFHFANGWAIAFFYALMFQSWHQATWWLGVIIGFVHGLFVLLVVMPVLPSVHPRMASEQRGPTPTRQLEPPGFAALHYGRRTPISVILAHLAYGAIQGAFYQVV
ncbi:MAG: hypothetical protein QOF51_2172 [Chloroflexota bacterium]|jgi:hypothetical protein|nr:hypothetical protein [Chloroflexota bacterium]